MDIIFIFGIAYIVSMGCFCWWDMLDYGYGCEKQNQQSQYEYYVDDNDPHSFSD